MGSDSAEQIVREFERTHRIAWIAIIIGCLAFLPLDYVTVYLIRFKSFVISAPIFILFSALAIFFGLLGVWLRLYLLSEKRMRKWLLKEVDLKKIAFNPRTRQTDETRLREIEGLDSVTKRVLAFQSHVLRVFIISWSLIWGIVVIGFLASTLARTFVIIVPFQVAAIILCLALRPRPQRFIERAKELLSQT